MARFVAHWFNRHGIDAVTEEVAAGRPNVRAVVRGTGRGRSLLLNAHLDTVGVAGMALPFGPDVQNGRLYGRGALDTKGGLAAFMVATVEASTRGLPGDVIFTGVIDEEYASIGTEALLPHVRADTAIVAEPTNLEIHPCHKGFVWLEVETHGRAAHGSRFKEGVDAIAKMGKFLAALDDFGRRLESGVGHPLLGPASVHASLINGGQELSSYPQTCRVSIERRTLPGETPAQVQEEIHHLLDRVGADDPQFVADCRVTFSREPLEVDRQAPIVEIMSRCIGKELGREGVIGGTTGWTDAALLNSVGIPSIVFGPAGEGLHGTNEWVDLESVRQCASIVMGAIAEFCGR
jgi:acetylornithine deacetylase